MLQEDVGMLTIHRVKQDSTLLQLMLQQACYFLQQGKSSELLHHCKSTHSCKRNYLHTTSYHCVTVATFEVDCKVVQFMEAG